MPVLGTKPAAKNAPPAVPASDVTRILELQVPVIVKLAERRLSLSEVLRMGVGSVIEFDKRSDEPLTLQVNNKVVAAGEAVKVGENFGLRLTQVGDTKALIQSLGGRRRNG